MSDERLRTFVAISLPDAVRRGLEAIQSDWRGCGFPVRWVRGGSIHLTLKFLGEIEAASVAAVEGAMQRAAAERTGFRLRTEGVGVFPAPRNARVLWAGIGGDRDRLLSLHASLEEALAAEGFSRDRRPFQGHLTLGRAKGRIPAGVLAEALSRWESHRSEYFPVSEIVLYRSRLLPGGAVYDPLRTAALRAQEPGEA